MTEAQGKSCIVVGAGIAGLAAAHKLKQGGVHVTVIDKARGVGGRMATRRFEGGVFDHGAQYFTARSERFKAYITGWTQEGRIKPWGGDGFQGADGAIQGGGHERYIGVGGMTDIPKGLAEHLGTPIKLNARVALATHDKKGWTVQTVEGETLSATALLMTPPAEQTLAILDASGVKLSPEVDAALRAIQFDPCFAVMARLEQPSNVPAPGGLWLSGEPISWLSDNYQKGISEAYGVTIHAGGEFSRENWERPFEEVAKILADYAQSWLGSKPIALDVQRWRYSIPTQLHPESHILTDTPHLLAFAGDAFGGARVEGAFLSGYAAAEALIGALG